MSKKKHTITVKPSEGGTGILAAIKKLKEYGGGIVNLDGNGIYEVSLSGLDRVIKRLSSNRQG